MVRNHDINRAFLRQGAGLKRIDPDPQQPYEGKPQKEKTENRKPETKDSHIFLAVRGQEPGVRIQGKAISKINSANNKTIFILSHIS